MAERWVRQTLTAKLHADAHLGSGSGGGSIDALVARDRHDRPVIWASHLEGVLRDAARRLRGDQEAEAFFGRRGGDYARGDRQRAVFTSLYTKDDPGRRIWHSTAREAFDNRAPKDDTLRAIEYVPKGTKFVGEVELPASQLDTLKRVVQEVDALGSARSTGAGRVELRLDPALADAPSTPRKTGRPTGRLVLLLKNRDPLCITATSMPDNLIPSLAFVPGRTLLGAIAAWLIAENQRDTASLLTSGKVSVSDALPLPDAPSRLDDVEVLPAPLSLKSEKPEGAAGDIPWWAQPTAPTKRLDAWSRGDDSPKLKRPEDDLFVFREGANTAWKTFRPARRVRLRNGRPDPKQADALLFAIEQIVEDTYFLAELHGPVEALTELAEKLGPVLEGRRWLRVGRGGAPVEIVDLAWLGAALTPRVPDDRALLILTSDLLVRDEYLRWRTRLDQSALAELLGDDVQLGNDEQDSVMVHGFNGTSRLWRMPAAAIRRGSVFEISGPGVAKLAERAARRKWLGERTHEGFGRFRIDDKLPGVTHGAPSSIAPNVTPDVDEDLIAQRTQEWFCAHKSLAEPGSSGDPKPSPSQWFELVAALDRGDVNAPTSRPNPTTSGGRGWRHNDAKAILEELQKVQQHRALHARLFVRWLRAEMRTRSKDVR